MTSTAVNAQATSEFGTPEQLGPGVHLLTLPLPLVNLKTVNAYVIADGDDTILIDPGWANEAGRTALSDSLHARDIDLADISRILVTHGHWDHLTQALELRREFGTPILLGAGEQFSIAGFRIPTGRFPEQAVLIRRAGNSALADQIDDMDLEDHELDIVIDDADQWLNDGDEITVGNRVVTAHHTPGHTRGHFVFADQTAGVMFTGDHILPRITPSIGFERSPELHPLRNYLDSLRATLTLPDAMMAPAHGDTSPTVHQRAQELLDHHAERLSVIADLVAQGHSSAAEVAGAMTWTRRAEKLTALAPMHQMIATLEVAAHLDVLALLGDLRQDDSDGVARYTVS